MTPEESIERRKAWAVYTNYDLTEGRLSEYILSFHWCKASAIRAGKKKYVMGTDCPVREVLLFKHKNCWYGPTEVEPPTKDDERIQAEMDKVEAVLDKARNLGLTDQELATLGYFK